MSDVIRNATAYAGGEAMRVSKSKEISMVDDTANRIFAVQIPRKALIQAVRIEATEAINGTTASLSVGFVGNGEADNNTFFQDATALASGVALGIAAVTGAQYKYFQNGGGNIVVSPVKGNATTGKVRLFVTYTVIH